LVQIRTDFFLAAENSFVLKFLTPVQVKRGFDLANGFVAAGRLCEHCPSIMRAVVIETEPAVVRQPEYRARQVKKHLMPPPADALRT
jgi:hypothetical protein